MIIYRDASRPEPTATRLTRLRRLVDRGAVTALLVEAGEFEQGVLDAASPDRDDWGPVERRLRHLALAAGHAFLAADRGESPAPYLAAARAALDLLEAGPLPAVIPVRPPEGYVHYAVDPAGYAAAAAAYRREVGPSRAANALVIGVRSIGTSLSAAVAAALNAPAGVTVRPRGGPGCRRIVAAPALAAVCHSRLAAGADVLVVDEGPGATGETLAAVADWLASLGVARERLVLFPSRADGMPLAPEHRRAWFAAARKFAPPPDGARLGRAAARLDLAELLDLSAGGWRALVPGAAGLPACVVHERRKSLCGDGSGRRYLLRYAGLGAWGDAVAERAGRLADAGLGPPPLGSADGFLALPWVEGRPAGRDATLDRAFLCAIARYLAGRTRVLRTGARVETGPILEMLETNAREALGGHDAGLAAAVRRLERLPEREAIIPDARLDLHEWIAGAHGYAKVDALDHGDGVRLPGPADPAWDLAGAVVELGLDPSAAAELAERHADATGDSRRGVVEALAAHLAPYAAWRLADALLSMGEAEAAEDRRRFRRRAARYRLALEDALRAAR